MCIRLLLLLITFYSQLLFAEAGSVKSRLAHANHYAENIDVTQYLASEKLDGVRGYWDGENLYTRTGHKINAPTWFTQSWPKRKLDGELWIARNHFEEVSGIVRRIQPNDEDWQRIRFMLFDMHPLPDGLGEPFELRLRELKRLVDLAANPSLAVIPQYPLQDSHELQVQLRELVESGAEGVMLHRKRAAYRAGRSNDILKLKPYWDAEAKVVAHIGGKGKYVGLLGAIEVEGVSDKKLIGERFRIGSGFSDAERVRPPAIGSIITYRFQGYTKYGLPRFPVYLRARPAL